MSLKTLPSVLTRQALRFSLAELLVRGMRVFIATAFIQIVSPVPSLVNGVAFLKLYFSPDKYDVELRQPVAWKKPFPFCFQLSDFFSPWPFLVLHSISGCITGLVFSSLLYRTASDISVT